MEDVYPELFRIGDFVVTSFGAMLAIACLVALWLYGRELAWSGLTDDAVNAAAIGVAGGLLGAKLLWTIEFSGTDSLAHLFFSRGGLSWFGGFLGGLGSGVWMLRRHRVPLLPALAAATPALAIGHAIGRVGCFLVGDDYGRPSDLPWAVAFPRGLPPTAVAVHPTQLYETVALVILAWWLIRWRRGGVSDRTVLGRYLLCAGAIRFAIEFVRINRQILGPFTLAQLIASAVACAGAALLVSGREVRTSSKEMPRRRARRR
jgi:phosphatidylglycerol:prolipoprotein diacylglycerol transferase